MRRPALLTQAEVTRVVKGAWKANAAAVEIKPDGTILILPSPPSPELTEASEKPLARKREVIL